MPRKKKAEIPAEMSEIALPEGVTAAPKSKRGRKKSKPDAPEATALPPLPEDALPEGVKDYRLDPVGYVKDVLGMETTPMQKHIFSLALKPPYRVLVSCGCGVGKCVEASERIPLSDGRMVAASDLIGRFFAVQGWSEDGSQKPCLATASDNGIEPVYRITTKLGRSIVRTANHPLYAGFRDIWNGHTRKIGIRGWTEVKDLAVDDLVLVPAKLDIEGKRRLSDDQVKMIGYLLGDGGTVAGITFTQMDGPPKREFTEVAERLGCKITNPEKITVSVSGEGDSSWKTPGRNPIRNMAREWGIFGCKSKHKRFPACVWELPNDQLALMLNRLFACDGWAYVHKREGGQTQSHIAITLASEGMIRDIEMAMLRFGIHGRVRKKEAVFNFRRFPAWEWCISAAPAVQKFAKFIGIYGKEEKVGGVLGVADAVVKPFKWRFKNAPEGYLWDSVKSIECLGERPTVAISVPERETYLSTFVEHNSVMGAMTVNWFFDSYVPSESITTAPTTRDIRDVIYSYIREQRTRAGLPGAVGNVTAELRGAGDRHTAKGFAAERKESLRGRHQRYQLFVIDEGTGVDDQFWDSIDTMFHPHPGHIWIVFFNPLDTSSRAYREWNRIDRLGKSVWHKVEMGCLTHPNVVAGLKGEPEPFPGAVSLAQIEDLVQKYCDPLEAEAAEAADVQWPPPEFATPGNPARWYRPGPYFESNVLGRWPSSDVFGVWSRYAWQRALQPIQWRPSTTLWPEAGVDLAGRGADYTVIHFRWGPVSIHHERHNGWDARRTAERLKMLCLEMAEKVNRLRPADSPRIEPEQILVKYDADGLGYNLETFRGDFNFRPVCASGSPIRHEQYHNKRAESWFHVCGLAKEGHLSVAGIRSEFHTLLEQQLLAPRWTQAVATGKIVLEDKDVTKERLGCSPDDADALILAYAPVGNAATLAWEMQAVAQNLVSPAERLPLTGERQPWRPPTTVPEVNGMPGSRVYEDMEEDEDRVPGYWHFGHP